MIFEHEVRRISESNSHVLRRSQFHCCECGEHASVVSYELKDGPDEGIYYYCFECAKALRMLRPSHAAGTHLKITQRTVRAWCGKGLIEACKDSRERWWVVFDPHVGTPVLLGY